MRVEFEPEQIRTETRFHPDTVKKAVALAQQLEQKRRETLSLEQVGELAGELNLDPQLLQQALAQISAEEVTRARAQMQTPVTVQKQRQLRTAWILLVIGMLLAIPLLLIGYLSVSVAPPTATVVEMQAPPQVVEPAPPAPPTPKPLPQGR